MTARGERAAPRRSDAQRNRTRALSAARELLGDRSADFSMAEVARRAGIGMATLYRNFPGRTDLLEALYAEEVDELCDAAQLATASPSTETPAPASAAQPPVRAAHHPPLPPPLAETPASTPTSTTAPEWEALVTWLRRFRVFHATKHPIAAELLRHGDADQAIFGRSRERVVAAGRPLLAAAQQAGQARGDLSLDQVLDLVVAAATIPGAATYVEPILEAVLDGLRAPTDPSGQQRRPGAQAVADGWPPGAVRPARG